jgi:hypothetical protein
VSGLGVVVSGVSGVGAVSVPRTVAFLGGGGTFVALGRLASGVGVVGAGRLESFLVSLEVSCLGALRSSPAKSGL